METGPSQQVLPEKRGGPKGGGSPFPWQGCTVLPALRGAQNLGSGCIAVYCSVLPCRWYRLHWRPPPACCQELQGQTGGRPSLGWLLMATALHLSPWIAAVSRVGSVPSHFRLLPGFVSVTPGSLSFVDFSAR